MAFEGISRLALGKPGDALMPTIVPLAMPSLPPDIGEWLQPELLVGVLWWRGLPRAWAAASQGLSS